MPDEGKRVGKPRKGKVLAGSRGADANTRYRKKGMIEESKREKKLKWRWSDEKKKAGHTLEKRKHCCRMASGLLKREKRNQQDVGSNPAESTTGGKKPSLDC